MVFPMPSGRVRVIVQVDDHTPPATAPLPLLQRLVDQRCPGVDIRRSHWLTTFDIHHAQVPQYRTGRAFLAGDAAHVHSPAGGQGMNTGMQDAFNLAWKLAAVVRGAGNDALLDSYHAERHPVAAHVIERSTTLTTVARSATASPRRYAMLPCPPCLVGSEPNGALASWTEETDLDYRGSPIVTGNATSRLHPGDHAPDVAGTTLRDHLNALSRDTAVLTFDHLDSAYEAALAGLPRIVIAGGTNPTSTAARLIDDPQQRIANRYGCTGGGVVLIRPDGYIGHIDPRADPEAINTYRARIRL